MNLRNTKTQNRDTNTSLNNLQNEPEMGVRTESNRRQQPENAREQTTHKFAKYSEHMYRVGRDSVDMNEIGMHQVMAVTSGTPREFANEET